MVRHAFELGGDNRAHYQHADLFFREEILVAQKIEALLFNLLIGAINLRLMLLDDVEAGIAVSAKHALHLVDHSFDGSANAQDIFFEQRKRFGSQLAPPVSLSALWLL